MSVVSVLCLAALAALTTTCVWVAVAQLQAIRTIPSTELSPLLHRLRRTAREQRVAVAVEGTAPSSWEGRLVRSLGTGVAQHEQVDAVSEAVGEAAAMFGTHSRWGTVLVRIQASGGLLIAALALIQSERIVAGIVLAVGVTAALGVAASSRRATRDEQGRREQIDQLIEVLGFLERAPSHGRDRRSQATARSSRRARPKLDR